MIKLAIIGSGSGSNCQCIQDEINAGHLDAQTVCILSDVVDARILERARAQNIPAHHIDCAPFKTKLDGEAEQRVIRILREAQADLIVLAGFMRMVKTGLLSAFAGRILNIHPSLLPAFPGLNSWKQALDYGAKVTGCTVHFVDSGMDTGPIIIQKTVPILDNDTPESLHARIQQQEHIAYPEAISLIANGNLTVKGRRVYCE
jgi:phosphoribosylglycinamide formyltransferase-1